MSVEFDRGLPESLTQGLLIGKLLVGGLGVLADKRPRDADLTACHSQIHWRGHVRKTRR